MEPYTLDSVHERIANIYRFFAKEAPGVTPLEVGELAELWALVEYAHDHEVN